MDKTTAWWMVYSAVVAMRFHPKHVPALGKLSKEDLLHELWECVNVADRAIDMAQEK